MHESRAGNGIIAGIVALALVVEMSATAVQPSAISYVAGISACETCVCWHAGVALLRTKSACDWGLRQVHSAALRESAHARRAGNGLWLVREMSAMVVVRSRPAAIACCVGVVGRGVCDRCAATHECEPCQSVTEA